MYDTLDPLFCMLSSSPSAGMLVSHASPLQGAVIYLIMRDQNCTRRQGANGYPRNWRVTCTGAGETPGVKASRAEENGCILFKHFVSRPYEGRMAGPFLSRRPSACPCPIVHVGNVAGMTT